MGLLYKMSSTKQNKEKIMDDKQIINVLLTKIQKLNQEILQHEINNAAKDLEIAELKKQDFKIDGEDLADMVEEKN
tara:strand:- start:326 stop:553 length:228 start_codon:yes stop_codon:yes gene_type:complete